MSPATSPVAAGASLTPSQSKRLGQLARLPLAWTASARRRRLLVLGLAAPGFGLAASTPGHQNLVLLGLGGLLFAAALAFRRWSEPVFVRAEAAGFWPPSLPVCSGALR